MFWGVCHFSWNKKGAIRVSRSLLSSVFHNIKGTRAAFSVLKCVFWCCSNPLCPAVTETKLSSHRFVHVSSFILRLFFTQAPSCLSDFCEKEKKNAVFFWDECRNVLEIKDFVQPHSIVASLQPTAVPHLPTRCQRSSQPSWNLTLERNATKEAKKEIMVRN